MIEKSNIISYEMSDRAILEVLGRFVKETRLRQNKTQEDLAASAGIQRMTLIRVEKGEGGSMATFVRLLRSLEQFHVFHQFVVLNQVSPLQLAKQEQTRRQRARSKASRRTSNDKQSDW